MSITIAALPMQAKAIQSQAISDFTQAIKINPEYAESYHNRGLSWDKEVIQPKPWQI